MTARVPTTCRRRGDFQAENPRNFFAQTVRGTSARPCGIVKKKKGQRKGYMGPE